MGRGGGQRPCMGKSEAGTSDLWLLSEEPRDYKTIPSTFSRKLAASEEAGSQGGVPEWFCRSSVSHQNLVFYMLDEERCVDELMWGTGDSAAPGPSHSTGPC